MRIYNSLTRRIEEFAPIDPPRVRMYTCGPTVYAYVTIGNWRTYVLGDFALRSLKYLGYQVTYVMNITDVGHLTGDNLGDADTGEDRLEKAARAEGRNAWEIARFYTQDFYEGFDRLNLTHPDVWPKATDHIQEQIALIQEIKTKGFAYQITDGIYFDTKAYEAAGNTYGELSTLDTIKAGARVEPNPEKRDPRDFALWKYSSEGVKRQMEWDSPWGTGFPGWHIECSAMSMKYLGSRFDLHLGGEDLRSTHHPNEIAQSEAATGQKPFVKYWVHGAFLLVYGGRMGKSLGNAYRIQDLADKGFEPLALRYFYLTGHYRKQLNFTWEALGAAQQAYRKLVAAMTEFKGETERLALSAEKLEKVDAFRQRFREVIGNDLDTAGALAVVWEVVKSNIPGTDKYDLLREFDEVLGLDLVGQAAKSETPAVIPEEVQKLVGERDAARQRQDWAASDTLREQIVTLGFAVEDTPQGTKVKKRI